MTGVRLILALHNHQPVGNFSEVFEHAYRDCYLPFLEVMEDYADLPFVLHTSGPLLEWLVENRPEYVSRLQTMVDSGRVEILGGGFFEPILPMIPQRDRIGQVKAFTDYLRDTLGANVRGAWLAERVWEPQLVSDLADAGVEYLVLDDYHFHKAGLTDEQLRGYYLSEDQGRLIKVFPASEQLRYQIPYLEPHETYLFLRDLATNHPGATVVFADDGEKFGVWPESHREVYQQGWLRRFCDMLIGNREWLHTTTFARSVDSSIPLGKIYLPDCSYREMTEWALPTESYLAQQRLIGQIEGHPEGKSLRHYLRGGGAWRNFKVRYPETNEMYSRMLGISNRLEALKQTDQADPDLLEAARQELYRGQCNCPYWHGAFGGLYLPHLRSAIYQHLIAAHDILDEAEGLTQPRVSLEVSDYNLDARQEVKLENDRLIAFVRPAQGGHIYELDVRHCGTNLLNTLDRRPEAYHNAMGIDSSMLVYDRSPRKSLVDHFYPIDVQLKDLIAGYDLERGDFVSGTYLSKAQRQPNRVTLLMERPGWVDGHPVQLSKSIQLQSNTSTIEVIYTLEDLPVGIPIHFAVELNLAGMAGHADDRYFSDLDGERLGTLDSRLDLENSAGLCLTDEWLDLNIELSWSHEAGLWCFPIETMSLNVNRYEGVYQSSVVMPHWLITADESQKWQVTIRWTIDRVAGEDTNEPSDTSQLNQSFV